MRTDADLAFHVLAPEVAQRGLAVFRGEFGLGIDHRFGAPDGGDDHALAIDGGHLASRTVGEARQIAVHGQLAGIPCLNQAIGGPAANAVAGRLHHVIGAGLQRQLCLGVHVVLAGLLGEVHLDAGVGGEKREHLGGEVRIAGPAHEVHFAGRGEAALHIERAGQADGAQRHGRLHQCTARQRRRADRFLRRRQFLHKRQPPCLPGA